MKKIQFIQLSIVLILSLAIIQPSSAQMRTQVHLGLNGTTLTGRADSDFSATAKFTGGVGLFFLLSERLFVQGEVNYVVKGASIDGEILFNDGFFKVRSSVQYFEFPLLFGVQFGDHSFRPRLFAGPYLASKITAKITRVSQSGGPSFSSTDDSIVDWDYGVAAGVAIHFPLSGEEFAVGLRGSVGLAEVTKATEDVENFNQSLHNRTGGIYAAVIF